MTRRWFRFSASPAGTIIAAGKVPDTGTFVMTHRRFALRFASTGAVSLTALVTVSVALAGEPDWTTDPTYGSMTLSAGFSPDPHRIQLQAGGATRVDASLAPGCAGYLHAAAPDVDFYYEAGDFPLYLHVESASDTTLVVNGPDGRWYCNDDFNGLDPMLMFSNPESGLYSIWVGVHGDEGIADAVLNLTELGPSR